MAAFTEEELLYISNEFKRLEGKTFLDHAGASLYQESQMKNVAKDLSENLYLNPHTSKYTTDCIDQIRYAILNNFNANPDEFSIIFTSGATAAIKIVAESFNYSNDGCLLYLQDNHTSVLGMRDIAKDKHAEIINITRDNLIKSMLTYENIRNNEYRDAYESHNAGLFVYPAQCNFSGYKYPLKWIEYAKDGALNEYANKHYSEWAVLLDAAAFVSTNKLDLSVYKPDFTCISFYKIFGYPTGLGALIVKNSSVHMLNDKAYYGGGTVEIAMSRTNHHVKRDVVHERFEDGTIPFLAILSVKHGFDALNRIISRPMNVIDVISQHTFNLSRELYQRLKSLRHSNGNEIARIYSDTSYDDIRMQGGIVNFNLMRANGEFIGYAEVIHMAELFNIYIRSGCFCNPGACQRHLNLSNDDLLKHHKAGHKCGDNNDLIDGISTGSIRVSFGYMSTRKDIDSLMDMIIKCFVEGTAIYIKEKLSVNNSIPNLNKSNDILEIQNIKICDTALKSEINSDELKCFNMKGHLKAIHIYPIKSCASFKVKSWEIGEKGFVYDREWMIVSENGVALTQKQDTRLCVIQPKIDLNKNVLTLSFPGVDDISIPIDVRDYQSNIKNNICHSKVCGDRIQGYDCGDDVADWLTDVLGLPNVRLIKQHCERTKNYDKQSVSSSISLSNQAQYLMINLSSIKWLADKIESREFDDRIDNLLERFRGNLIVETDEEFEEFKWKKINIGTNVFNIDGPCTRCQMVCIDQETGLKTTEPLRTISKEFKGKLHFGIYLTHEYTVGTGSNLLSIDESVLVSMK